MYKIKKGQFISNYYLGLAVSDGNLYLEILNIDTHNSLIDFIKGRALSDPYLKMASNIGGCAIYNNSYFYVVLFSSNIIEAGIQHQFFRKTNKTIFIVKEDIDDSFYFIDSPTQLYQYVDDKLVLLPLSK